MTFLYKNKANDLVHSFKHSKYGAPLSNKFCMLRAPSPPALGAPHRVVLRSSAAANCGGGQAPTISAILGGIGVYCVHIIFPKGGG